MDFIYNNDELEAGELWLNRIGLAPEMIGEERLPAVGEYLGDGDDLSKL